MPEVKGKTQSRLETMRNKSRIENLYEEKNEQKEKVSDKKRKDFLNKMGNSKKVENGMPAQEVYAQELVQRTTAGIEARLIATDMFDMGTMSIGDGPLYYTIDDRVDPNQRGRVLEMVEHGGAPRETIIQNGNIVRVTPYVITSPEEEMVKFNLRQGDISNMNAMETRVEEGMAARIDDDAWKILENGLTTDLTNVDGIYIDDRIQEYPTSTDIDLSNSGGTDEGLSLKTMKTVASHFDQLGIPVENVYIPANRREDLWNWLSIPAGYSDGSGITASDVVPSDIHSSVIRTGSVNNLFGYNMNLIPLNTLNGTAANGPVYIWVSTSAPAGVFREIPEVGSTYTHEDAEKVYYQQSRGIAMFQTPNQKMNYLRVRIA